MVHGAVDQRGGHVLVAEHASPAGELDVRGVDDAPGLVGIRYDLEQEPGALLVDRHVAELVDDREPRLGDLPELRVEPVLPFRAAQPHEQSGRGEEPGWYRAHAREPAQRDREMGLAGADGPVEHEVLATVDEVERCELRAPPQSAGMRRFDQSYPSMSFAFGNPAALRSLARFDRSLDSISASSQPSIRSSWAGVARSMASASTSRVNGSRLAVSMILSHLAMVSALRLRAVFRPFASFIAPSPFRRPR